MYQGLSDERIERFDRFLDQRLGMTPKNSIFLNLWWGSFKKSITPVGSRTSTSARTVPADCSRRLNLLPKKQIQKPAVLTSKASAPIGRRPPCAQALTPSKT